METQTPQPEQNPTGRTRNRSVHFAPLPPPRATQENHDLKPLQPSTPEKEKESSDSDSFECDSESSSSERRLKQREAEIEQSKQEWQAIEQQQDNTSQSLPTENGVGGTKIDYSSVITFYDALIYFQNEAKNMEIKCDTVHYQTKSCFCLEKKPQPFAQEAYNEAYKISKISFDESNLTHFRLLTSLHVAMTGILTPPPRRGKHWQDLGFQTDDPITDLRATGMLGLLMPLGMFSRFKAFSSRVLKISRGECPFPLMVVLIVYVKETLDALKSTDILDKAVSKEDAWNVILIYFTGLVNILVSDWERENMDFEHDFNHFNLVAARGKTKIDTVMAAGYRAVKEDDNRSMPALKEDFDIPPP